MLRWTPAENTALTTPFQITSHVSGHLMTPHEQFGTTFRFPPSCCLVTFDPLGPVFCLRETAEPSGGLEKVPRASIDTGGSGT